MVVSSSLVRSPFGWPCHWRILDRRRHNRGPRLFPESSGTRGTTIVFAGISLGTIAGLPAGTFIGGLAGWRFAFGATAVVAVLLIFAQVAFVPPVVMGQSTKWRDLPRILRISRARLGLVLVTLALVGHFFAYTYIAPFLGQIAGMKVSSINSLLLLMGVFSFLGNALGGWAAGQDIRRAMIGTSMVIALSVILLVLIGGGAFPTYVLIGTWGLGFGALPIVMQTWMMRAAPQAQEPSAIIFVATAQMAIATGSVIGGFVVDHLGVTSAMLVGGFIVAATVPIVWVYGRESRLLQREHDGLTRSADERRNR